MTLDRKLLYHYVRDALAPYSEDFAISDSSNPVAMRLNGTDLSVHLSYVHDSGNARANDDENRIQLPTRGVETQANRDKEGQKVAFVGFFMSGRAFVAWDPRHVFSLGASSMVSVYARKSMEGTVESDLAAAYEFKSTSSGESHLTVALPRHALGLYLENIRQFHRLRSERQIQEFVGEHLQALAGEAPAATKDFEVVQDEERVRFSYTRKAFPRDPRFKEEVLAAYQRTCCVCDRQLALVQAAHIIPHSRPDSPNTVTNGLALCVEHHRLYDDALLLPGPGRRLVFNQKRADYLAQTGQEKGLDEIKARNDAEFTVPGRHEHQPSEDFLQKGLEIRMGHRPGENA